MSLDNILQKLEEKYDVDFECWEYLFFAIPYYDYETVYGCDPEGHYDPRSMGLRDDDSSDHWQTNQVLMKIPPKELEQIIRLWEKGSENFRKIPHHQLVDNIYNVFFELCEHCESNGIYLPERVVSAFKEVKENIN